MAKIEHLGHYDTCQRCQGAPATHRVRSDEMDIAVCADCAEIARGLKGRVGKVMVTVQTPPRSSGI